MLKFHHHPKKGQRSPVSRTVIENTFSVGFWKSRRALWIFLPQDLPQSANLPVRREHALVAGRYHRDAMPRCSQPCNNKVGTVQEVGLQHGVVLKAEKMTPEEESSDVREMVWEMSRMTNKILILGIILILAILAVLMYCGIVKFPSLAN